MSLDSNFKLLKGAEIAVSVDLVKESSRSYTSNNFMESKSFSSD